MNSQVPAQKIYSPVYLIRVPKSVGQHWKSLPPGVVVGHLSKDAKASLASNLDNISESNILINSSPLNPFAKSTPKPMENTISTQSSSSSRAPIFRFHPSGSGLPPSFTSDDEEPVMRLKPRNNLHKSFIFSEQATNVTYDQLNEHSKPTQQQLEDNGDQSFIDPESINPIFNFAEAKNVEITGRVNELFNFSTQKSSLNQPTVARTQSRSDAYFANRTQRFGGIPKVNVLETSDPMYNQVTLSTFKVLRTANGQVSRTDETEEDHYDALGFSGERKGLRVRMSEEELTGQLLLLFKKSPYMNIQQINEYVQQPINYLKDVLNKIADVENSGVYRSHYRLRQEYRNTI